VSDLETLLRERAAKGELNYLSLAHTPKGFEVAYMGTTKFAQGKRTVHSDPVCAILAALTGKPGAEPEKAPRKPRAPRKGGDPGYTFGLLQNFDKPKPDLADDFSDILG
jgi:hypothetical protein